MERKLLDYGVATGIARLYQHLSDHEDGLIDAETMVECVAHFIELVEEKTLLGELVSSTNPYK